MVDVQIDTSALVLMMIVEFSHEVFVLKFKPKFKLIRCLNDIKGLLKHEQARLHQLESIKRP